MKVLRFIFSILFILASTHLLQAQDTTSDSESDQLYLITKIDGLEYYGYILEDDGREVLLKTKTIGNIYINKSEIKSIVPIEDGGGDKDSETGYKDYRTQGPFTTRYYLSTNALPIKKNENYAMLHLYGPEVHFAVSDNLSLGVMSSWIASPIGLAAKYSFDSESNTHFAIGTIIGSSGFLANAQVYGGLHWATVTQGTRTSNISFSAGYGYSNLASYNGQSYGRRYVVVEKSSSQYYPYGRTSAALRKVRENDNSSVYLSRDSEIGGAAVLGVAGITPVGKKASLIVDVMAFLPTKYKRQFRRSFVVEDVAYQQYDGNTYVDVVEDVEIREYELVASGLRPTFLIMPGMRFNKSYDKAFQVVLAGVVTMDRYGDVLSFPVPMVSWLRTF